MLAWVTEADISLNPFMLAEFADMRDRHPEYFHVGPLYLPPVFNHSSTNTEQWRPLVTLHFDDVDTALCIISYESGGNPEAKNPRSTARGLFQILASLWAPHFGVSYEDLYDPELNVYLASEIYLIQGWGAWTVYPLCD